MKIREQTRKRAAGCSKHRFEVVDRTDEVSNKYTARRSLRGLKRFSKSINKSIPQLFNTGGFLNFVVYCPLVRACNSVFR